MFMPMVEMWYIGHICHSLTSLVGAVFLEFLSARCPELGISDVSWLRPSRLYFPPLLPFSLFVFPLLQALGFLTLN